jgi:cell division transport system ATP-binding protein
MLSGGEKQRVAIARSLIHQPKLLIADEPTGNLDPKTAAGIVDLYQKLHVEGATVIFATHNHNLVRQVKQRTLRIEDGRLVE